MRLNNLTLIRPGMGNYRAKDALPPLSMGILAARTPKRVAITFWDERVEAIPLDTFPDLVAMTVETFTARRAYEIARYYRDHGIPIVMGGYHPTLLPDEVLKYADVVVVGDAEGVWEQIIRDFEKGTLRSIYTGGNGRSLDDYLIDRSIFSDKKYLPVELVQYGRGCRHSCDFCSIEAFYRHTIRIRSVKSVVAEIETLNRKRLIFFVDDNLFSSKENLYALLNAITPLEIRWSCQISIDISLDDALLDQVAVSGCIFVLIGFESLDTNNLRQMGKKWNKNGEDYRDIVAGFHRRGIAVYGTFVFGYDNDTPDLIDASVQFALETKMEIANFNPLTPTPGTGLYNRLKNENRLLRDCWWLDPCYRYGDPIFQPARMKPELFAAKCFAAKKRFYSWSSILSRLVLSSLKFSPFQFMILLLANIVSRKEILRKQNRLLGDS